jgi:hypothetical protein
MGYQGGDESDREPRRPPGEVIKMGGKAKKGSRAKGVNGGVDGRGKGEENWIGGQKTRRQVKVSTGGRFGVHQVIVAPILTGLSMSCFLTTRTHARPARNVRLVFHVSRSSDGRSPPHVLF